MNNPTYQIYRGSSRFGYSTYYVVVTVTDAPWGHKPGSHAYAVDFHKKRNAIGNFKSLDVASVKQTSPINDAPEKVAAYAVHVTSAWKKS